MDLAGFETPECGRCETYVCLHVLGRSVPARGVSTTAVVPILLASYVKDTRYIQYQVRIQYMICTSYESMWSVDEYDVPYV